jgi:glycolate oxidase FAD binding subunit
MTATDLLNDLRRAAPNARLLTGGGTDGYHVDGRRPAAVALPQDAAEVAALLRLASAHRRTVVPRGGGTMLDQGNRPAGLDLAIDLTRLHRVIEHRPRDLTVTVEAGITIAALQAELATHGQMLALDPPLAGQATVGGVLAANAWGPRRQRYGTARDLLIGSRAVLADGTRVRSGGKVVKNVAGYDLNKLFIGSAGTLAILVEATFKLMPIPAALGMVVAAFPSVEAAHAVALAVTTSRLQPLTLDLIGPPAARRLAADAGGQPGGETWLLAAELGGPSAAVERTRRELVQMAAAGGSPEVTALEDAERGRMLQRLRDYGRSTDDPAALILRAAVLPSQVPDTVGAVTRAAGPLPAPAVIVRAGSGVVFSYWEDVSTVQATRIVPQLRAEISRLGGTLVVERAPVEAKAAIDVWGIAGADVELMRRVKQAYDPADILSPGRLV